MAKPYKVNRAQKCCLSEKSYKSGCEREGDSGGLSERGSLVEPHRQRLVYPHDATGQRRIDKNDRQQLTDVHHLQVEVQCLARKRGRTVFRFPDDAPHIKTPGEIRI